MHPLYIFDLDGTLALTDHRKHFLDDKDDPERWEKFYQACDKDLPNRPVIELFDSLYSRNKIFIWSGRSDLVYDKTIKWLANNTGLAIEWAEEILRMRTEGDHTEDTELKRRWLHELYPQDRKRLTCVFEDRQKVVDMWRQEGVTCLQVAPGEF